MIYKQQLAFNLGKKELAKRVLVYFKINNYRIRRSSEDILMAENVLPYTMHRHPLRFISFYDIRISGDENSSKVELTTDYNHLRKFIRRIFRLALLVVILPMLLLITRVGFILQDYGEDASQVWLILAMNFCLGLIVLAFVGVFSHRKFAKLQRLLIFGSGENPPLNKKIGKYFQEMLQNPETER